MKISMKLICAVMTLLSICLLTGCLSPVKVDTTNKYILKKMPCMVPIKKTSSAILLVSMPETRPAYDTTQMAYSIRPYQISYYSLNQWAEVPSEMFQPLLVQTMQNTHHFKAIVTPPYNGLYQYQLDTEILELLQDFTCCIPVLRMTVRAQIIKISTNKVIGTRQFSVIQPMHQRSPYGGVFAANDATAFILQGIAEFSLETIR